jgi:protein phosphatase inhibitor 2
MQLRLPTAQNPDRRRVTFDEEELREHDKERGSRMIIPDPDTPFMRSPVISDDDESPHQPRLRDTARIMAGVVQAASEVEEVEAKRQEFAAKRKAHYNEFRAIKETKSPSETGNG